MFVHQVWKLVGIRWNEISRRLMRPTMEIAITIPNFSDPGMIDRFRSLLGTILNSYAPRPTQKS